MGHFSPNKPVPDRVISIQINLSPIDRSRGLWWFVSNSIYKCYVFLGSATNTNNRRGLSHEEKPVLLVFLLLIAVVFNLDFEGTVPDKEGTFYFLGVGMTYTQPVTNTEYSLFFSLNTPPAIVVEGDYTGSITIVIE